MSTITDVTPSVSLTESAAREISRAMADSGQSPESFLRIGVAGGGCSGFQYSLGFDDKYDAIRDQLSEQFGIKVVVDKKSALYLDGTSLDHYDGIDRRGFVFNNPQAVKSCGCGSSFSA